MSERASELHRRAGELEKAGDLEAALEAYRAAAAQAPGNAALPYNIGNVLRRLRRFDEAIEALDQALALRPDMAVAHFVRATCRLQLGELLEGFREYEWRKDCPGHDDPRYGLPRQWAGESLTGKSLFIYPELFQGDLLQFARYALLAEMAGARVQMAAPEPMHAILQTMSPTLELLPEQAAAQDYDYASALMSLPAAFGTTLQTVPHGVYLHAQPARAALWRERIGAEGFRIGVVWQGTARDPERAFPLASLHPLAQAPGVRLISLQKGGGLEQLQTLPPGMQVESLGEDFDPGPDLFVDTAAAITACDLVITCDTSVAHLAGALGAATWVALPWLADWRWLEDRADSPWYPRARLYRQGGPREWGPVFEAMAADLRRALGR